MLNDKLTRRDGARRYGHGECVDCGAEPIIIHSGFAKKKRRVVRWCVGDARSRCEGARRPARARAEAAWAAAAAAARAEAAMAMDAAAVG